MDCGLCVQAGRVVDLRYRLPVFIARRASAREDCKRKAGLTCWTRADRAARIEIVTSAAHSAV